jgi:hypothetical protein
MMICGGFVHLRWFYIGGREDKLHLMWAAGTISNIQTPSSIHTGLGNGPFKLGVCMVR